MSRTRVVDVNTEKILFTGTIQQCAEFARISVSTVKRYKNTGHVIKSGLLFLEDENEYSRMYKEWFKKEWDNARYKILKIFGGNYEYKRLYDREK